MNTNETQDVYVETQIWENHGSPQTAEYTMGEEYNGEDTQSQRPLVLFFATRGGYSRGNDLTLSLSLSHCLFTHALYNHFTKVFNY